MAATALIEALRKHGADYELRRHEHTGTAAEEAAAVGVAPEETAKVVIVRGAGGFVRVVVPASHRVDVRKLRKVMGDPHAGLATETEMVGAYPDFELGAVPPFDSAYQDEVIIDPHVCRVERIVFDAGTHDESVVMRTSDLIELAQARLAVVCEH
jgi:Ala-tRNA(Pro) deacylase